MVAFSSLTKLATFGFLAHTVAHPGHEEHLTDRAVKRSFLANSRRSLSNCASKLETRGTLKAAEAHRRSMVSSLRTAANLETRDTDAVLNTSHHSSISGITVDSDSSVFFTDANSTCILSPEGEIGPFWVKGELNRQDIVDNEPGVVNYVHAQFINVNTCEPLPNLWWDIWNANSTGVYTGVQDDSNGNGDDASNLGRTALRGLQETDNNGIASFKTIFPGHYSGRATHVHVVGHMNATLLSNGTLSGGNVPHIGQLFYDQDIITEVESTYPYNTSTVDITLNSADRVFGLESEDDNSDPIFNYVYLDDTKGAAGGLFSWITIGVDPTASYDASYAALLTADGGVSNSNSGSAGAGAAPSGAAPSGAASAVPTA
ncbi:aromatic compound dioxygenase [Massarina eburnea CBS 473.64]|uniref:Aromatic compound dioxygenase n=1 Tax=Massarina eburnea CBS 473.64 TaxID=1395130 RepID=A0A6A6SDY8_9PLEO|nr:aromatic compound dioxygenase [Massarina eburnea CBS 473.64]